jgi:hypothetical protein
MASLLLPTITPFNVSETVIKQEFAISYSRMECTIDYMEL